MSELRWGQFFKKRSVVTPGAIVDVDLNLVAVNVGGEFSAVTNIEAVNSLNEERREKVETRHFFIGGDIMATISFLICSGDFFKAKLLFKCS